MDGETYMATCKACRRQFAYTGQEPDECARCCPDTASTWQPSQELDRIAPLPYKPPSPELMKLLEQTQQLVSDACMYGSAFLVTGPDGSMRRVDPSAASGREVISDYAKAWEDDIMTAGNADQVGGLKNLVSRTHEADKPGVTAMDKTDVWADLSELNAAFDPIPTPKPLTTATDGRFVPLPDGRTLDTHGMDDGTALTSMHPFSVQGAWERCLNGSGSSADHEIVMTEYRRASAAGEFDRLGEDDPARAIEDAANASDSDSLNTSWNVPISAMTRSDRVSDAAAGVDPALDIGTGNSHLGHRAMHAAAPVPLSPDAKGLVGALEEAAERWYDVADLIESPEGYRNGGFPRESAWRCLNAIEFYKNLPVPLVSEAEDADWAVNFVRSKAFQAQKDRIAALEIERSGMQQIIDLLSTRCQGWADEVTRLRSGMTSTENAGAHDYHGPTETVPHPDMPDRTVQRAVPDPAHEQFHRAVGDVLAGKIIPAARRQMEDALGRAPKEPTAAPDAILRGNKAPVGIVERKT